MELAFIFLIVAFLLAQGFAAMALGGTHERFARILARLMGRELIHVDEGLAATDWSHPYFYRLLAYVAALVLPVGLLIVMVAGTSMRCTSGLAGSRVAATCAVTRLHLNPGIAVGRRTEALGVVTSVRRIGAEVVVFFEEHEPVRVRGDAKERAIIAHQLDEVLAGRMGRTTMDIDSDVDMKLHARAPWALLALLLPNLLASFALARRSPKRQELVDEAARDAPPVAAQAPRAPVAPILGMCPRCPTPLVKDRGLLHEDVCPRCAGRLLPQEGVQRVLVDELGLSLEVLREVAKQYAGKRIGCPGCGAQMSPVTLKGAPSDLCFGCGALWLDKGELKRVSEGRWDEVG